MSDGSGRCDLRDARPGSRRQRWSASGLRPSPRSTPRPTPPEGPDRRSAPSKISRRCDGTGVAMTSQQQRLTLGPPPDGLTEVGRERWVAYAMAALAVGRATIDLDAVTGLVKDMDLEDRPGSRRSHGRPRGTRVRAPGPRPPCRPDPGRCPGPDRPAQVQPGLDVGRPSSGPRPARWLMQPSLGWPSGQPPRPATTRPPRLATEDAGGSRAARQDTPPSQSTRPDAAVSGRCRPVKQRADPAKSAPAPTAATGEKGA